MTEEYWAKWKFTRDERHPNLIWKNLERKLRHDVIMDKHPDELYGLCRTDNNYWRHYRASTKLSVDELAMMICREVGCDLSYCQIQMGKPRSSSQSFNNCMEEYHAFRDCFLHEKRLFKAMVPEEE